MERSKRDLEALVATQREQLTRYEKRLKDVVTAYKGLLKEKEALESSLNAINSTKEPHSSTDDATDGATALTNSMDPNDKPTLDDKVQLQTQIFALMNSLATLSAEKSRMEASFQLDKKQLRTTLAQKDQTNAELQAKIKENEDRAKADIDEVKAKWIVERQEREKETNNQMLMIRELQKLYADERHLKENIEMQLNNFKTQFASNEAENSRLRELQAQLKDARLQLKQLQIANGTHKPQEEMSDRGAVLKLLQQEMQQLKEQHAIAIKSEQKRVLHAEDLSRKQAALHEQRVANLESRLAELSSTVGNYDRLRQQDQDSINALKQKLQLLDSSHDAAGKEETNGAEHQRYKPTHDIAAIVSEISRLKKLLMSENAHAINPIDVSKVFAISAEHVHCQEELNRMQEQCDAGTREVEELKELVKVQKSHIYTLQEKVKVLNRNIDEQDLELKQHAERTNQAVKQERSKWKNILAELENESRCKVNDLEQQLQKQRQRSLQLLDEKEQEIKTLQTSFDVFQNATMSGINFNVSQGFARSERAASASDAESNDATEDHKIAVHTKRMSMGENCHMLHYANEIARKDIEIANLRKTKYAAETALRKAIAEKVTAQQLQEDNIASLEEQVDRLERCQSREGANLEYLKNVIISYIVTRDVDGKRHMLNAISAVLQFTPAETDVITAALQKK